MLLARPALCQRVTPAPAAGSDRVDLHLEVATRRLDERGRGGRGPWQADDRRVLSSRYR